MIFCGETISPGERKKIRIPVPGAEPLYAICLCGKLPGRTLAVTAGVHGCEYVGIQALRALASELSPAELSGNVILLPLANPTGFFARAKQVVPEDGLNLNRAFPGDENGSLTARLAYALEKALYPVADLIADLHGGDCNEALCPLVFASAVGDPAVNRIGREAAKVLDVPYQVRSGAKNGLYSWAVQCGIPAILIERGGQGRWSDAETAACRQDILSLMRYLEILAGDVSPRAQTEIIHTDYVEAEMEGFWYPLVQAGAAVRKGDLLGRLEDMDGEILQEVHAAFDGVALYYTTALGVRTGDPLVAYGHP